MDHAQPVPGEELCKPINKIYYLLMHIIRKELSMTSNVRVVFHVSAKTASGALLNGQDCLWRIVEWPITCQAYGSLCFNRRTAVISMSQSRLGSTCKLYVSSGSPSRRSMRPAPFRMEGGP